MPRRWACCIQCTPQLVGKAGVAPDMTFRFTMCKQVSVQVREPLWLWNPWGDSHEVQNGGNQWPHKMDLDPTKIIKKSLFVLGVCLSITMLLAQIWEVWRFMSETFSAETRPHGHNCSFTQVRNLLVLLNSYLTISSIKINKWTLTKSPYRNWTAKWKIETCFALENDTFYSRNWYILL